MKQDIRSEIETNMNGVKIVKEYIFSADLVRCLAIIAVIGIHLIIPITARPDYFGGTIWWFTFLLNGLFRISVPLFVMLSGYLTLGKTRSISDNNQRVMKRILIPLVAYYIIFNLVYATMAYLRQESFELIHVFHNLSKNTHSSLYFLVVLFFIQLLNPLWNLLTETKNLPILNYVWKFFLTLGATAYIFYYLSLREGEVFSTFTLWFMWLGYYLYGYVVKLKPRVLTKTEELRYWLLLSLGYVLTVSFGYVTLYLYHRGINELFYLGGQTYADAYLSVSVIMMTVGAFNLLMRHPKIDELGKSKVLKKIVIFIAGLSFALYLNHLLVIDIMNRFFGVTPDSPSMPNLVYYLIINTILTFALTIPIAFILRKTPYLRKLVGES